VNSLSFGITTPWTIIIAVGGVEISKKEEFYKMKFTSFLRQCAGSFLFSALLVSNWAVPVNAQSESSESREGAGRSIEGSWLLTVTIPVANLSFTAITTFAAGGVSSSTGASDRLAQISPLYGTWKQTGVNRFNRTVYFFQFDPLGVPIRMLKNKEVYHLKRRNEFEGDGRQYACDLSGENCVDQNTPFNMTGRFIPAVESDKLDAEFK
jgi:hypothetical protein